MRVVSIVALMMFAAPLLRAQPASPTAAASPIFRFESDELWLNLHQFLYVLGRAEAGMPDATRDAVSGAPADAERGLTSLSEDERRVWREAVSAYARGLSRKDAVFDDPLPALAGALAAARDAAGLSGVDADAATIALLERAAPIYRKAWWPAHRAANRAWQSSISALVDRHGAAVLAFITHAYGMTWPSGGYPVHVAAYTNWAGAFSTRGNLLIVSSLDVGTRGDHGLETVFHEGMHQWDSEMFGLLRTQARAIDKLVPNFLSHALIFYTAGDAVRRVIPSHVPYADAFGVWARGAQAFKAALQETWQPYLDGHGTRDEALAAVVKKTATDARR